MDRRFGDLIPAQHIHVRVAAKSWSIGHGHPAVLRHHQAVERACLEIDEQTFERGIRRHGCIQVQGREKPGPK